MQIRRERINFLVTATTIKPTQLPEIDLLCPSDLQDALAHLSDGACALAGGTDIILWASQQGEPRHLVWTGAISEMRGMDFEQEFVRIGAATTLSELIRSRRFREAVPAVVDGAQCVGSVQLRNQATLVGNLCTASPAGDTIPGLLVHDARVLLLDASGRHRELGLHEFLLGPGKTALSEGELVLALSLSPIAPGEMSLYRRFTQREVLDVATASVAVRVSFEPDQRTVREARLALGAVAPTVIEAKDAASVLCGTLLDDATLRTCAAAAVAASTPISDHRAGADYRRQLIATVIVDALTEVRQRPAPSIDEGAPK